MGLLSEGTPLTWTEIQNYLKYVKDNGIKQFIEIYNKTKTRNDVWKWGDEIEYSLVKFDHQNKRVCLLLKANDVIPILHEQENYKCDLFDASWRPEYANYMIEGSPAEPYSHEINKFCEIELNMMKRRKQLQHLLDEDEFVFTITVFPLLGCKNFTYPSYPATPIDGVTRSLFFPDQVIYQAHSRFLSLTRNSKERRNSKPDAYIPIFIDEKTPVPFKEDFHHLYGFQLSESDLSKITNNIYLDAAGFGAGCSCLQVTFQAHSIDEARFLYDQLNAFTPILLALSAASPIWRGYLSDVDCRWKVLTELLDDRTNEEKSNSLSAGIGVAKINKSRCDTVNCYLTEAGAKYNDIPICKDDELYGKLIENNIDHLLAQHVSSLFVREPLSLIKEAIEYDNESENHCFETIQSTVWQALRFKPPPSSLPSIGWRIEFRPTELQITDFENAAYAVFLALLTRVILTYNLNFLIPISKVDENMNNAQKRGACLNEKFHFRRSIFQQDSLNNNENNSCANEYSLMTINEIINGSQTFPGIITLIKNYLNSIDDIDFNVICKINKYLKLISSRANGNSMTNATWIRHFVMQHPKYANDSILTDEIAYDLMWNINLIANGKIECKELINV